MDYEANDNKERDKNNNYEDEKNETALINNK